MKLKHKLQNQWNKCEWFQLSVNTETQASVILKTRLLHALNVAKYFVGYFLPKQTFWPTQHQVCFSWLKNLAFGSLQFEHFSIKECKQFLDTVFHHSEIHFSLRNLKTFSPWVGLTMDGIYP